MFTPENISAEIKSLMEGPVTAGSIGLLASLLYIKEHCHIPLQSHHEGQPSSAPKLTHSMAQEWVRNMKNADGTTGPHWTMEKTEEARVHRDIDCDPLAFYVAMNMIYSDYAKVAEKVNANIMDFYVYMAKAFLDDKDAKNQGGEKLAQYYEHVVM